MHKLPAGLYRYEMQQLCKREKAAIVVEIGIYCADLSRLLVPIKTLKTLFMVDPWKEYKSETGKLVLTQEDADLLYESVKSWTQLSTVKDKVKLMRMTSMEAVKHFYDNTIDLIHIDGNHNRPAVKADVKNWLSIVRRGGLLTGDDYQADSVRSAVDGLLGSKNVKSIGNKIWYYRKPT